MNQHLIPARVASPGRILSRELKARGWTQKDLSEITGRPPQTINEIIRGSKQITPETALELSEAFGTSAEFWTNLEANYRLHLARKENNDQNIARRSHLYSLAPISELIKHGWIRAANSIDALEKEVCDFLSISSLNESPQLAANFRHTQEREPEIKAQTAWLKRVEHLVKRQPVAEFNRAKLLSAIPKILTYAKQAEDVPQIPPLLLSLGVHFIIVPHLSKTYLDGAAFYLGSNPVIALTLRYDRIDSFWFTLMHEIGHIVAGHQGVFLDNLENHDVNTEENEANRLACDWLLNPEAFTAFVKETRPHFSKTKIQRFADLQKRHPGIVLGRLHREGQVSYKNLRPLLVKVRSLLEPWIDASAHT